MTDATEKNAEGAVTTQLDGSVALITFAHPKANSLSRSLLSKLAGEIRNAGAQSQVNVIILRSGGNGAFCAGASFDELGRATDVASATQLFSGFGEVILAMKEAPQFTIARVHGKAVGGGVGLIAAADYAVALKDSAVRLSELEVGIGPSVIAPAITRKIGAGHFSHMCIDTAWRDAAWCERSGLFAAVYADSAQLDSAVAALASKLSAVPVEAARKVKAMLWAGTEGWSELLAARAHLSGELWINRVNMPK